MNRKIFKIGIICLLMLCTLTLKSCKKDVVVEENFPEMVAKMKSYKLVGKLESMFPSGTKECMVTVYYKQPNMYRVELKNVGSNEPQIMIKNNDGVYVLLPTVNKVFKVNSSWPINSSYPYLLQSLSKDIISDDSTIVTKDGDTTTLEFKAQLFDNAVATKQKVMFNSKTGLPKEVVIYDDKDTTIVRFVVESLDVDGDVSDELFAVDTSLTAARLSYEEEPLVFDRAITYPTYYPEDSSLVQEVITGTNDNKKVIMKYDGSAPFTIIEQYVNISDVTKTQYITADIYTMGGAICFVSNNNINFYDNGIEYTLASSALDYQTLVQMGESLRIYDLK